MGRLWGLWEAIYVVFYVISCLWDGYGLAMGWLWRGLGEAIKSYLRITLGYYLAMGWPWAGYGKLFLYCFKLLPGYGLAMGWLWAGYGLAIGWLWKLWAAMGSYLCIVLGD